MSDIFNIGFLDPERFIRDNNVKEVTANWVMMPSSTVFHPQGLFSEEIFGGLTTEDRLYNYGYINLRTKVLHPKVWKNLLRLKAFYGEVLHGRMFAKLDKNNELIHCQEDEPGAGTGYQFFMANFPKMKFKDTSSQSTKSRIEVLDKHRKNAVISKWLVLPAGLREYQIQSASRGASEEINKLYLGLMMYARAIDERVAEEPIYDVIRLALQKKIAEIYEYIVNMLQGAEGGKRGFLQQKFGARSIALGGRNVISAASLAYESPTDPRMHTIDQSRIPLIMCAFTFRPLVIYYTKHSFLDEIISPNHSQVAMINPNNYNLQDIIPDSKELTRWTTNDGLSGILRLFVNHKFRNSPITMFDQHKKTFYLYLVYDLGKTVFFLRNLEDFKTAYQNKYGKEVDMNFIRPVTYQELIYLATYMATRDKYSFITRYPAITVDSCYPSEVYVTTTDPGRLVRVTGLGEDNDFLQVPEYPVIGKTYIDSTVLHPCRLLGLGADHDGDTISNNSVMNEASIEECKNYLNSKSYLLSTSGQLAVSFDLAYLKLLFYNMTKD